MKTLALDLDGKNGLDTFLSRKWLMKYLGLKIANRENTPVKVFHTTNGWHLTLTLDAEIDDVRAVLIQCILGDDYRRSACLLLRIERGCHDWNILYKQKWKVNELGQQIEVSKEAYDPDLSVKVLKLLELGE